MADLWHISEEFPAASKAAGGRRSRRRHGVCRGRSIVPVLNGGAGGMSRGLLGGLFRQDDFHAAPKGFADGLGGMI